MMEAIIITGATGSMGAVAARKLSAQGIPVILACRDLVRGKALMDEILGQTPSARLELLELDLSSQARVRAFVAQIGDRRLGGIFNNAGTMNRHYTQSEDGFELTMAVNYLNVALLTRLLAPNFVPGAHVVNMVSMTTKTATLDMDWNSYGKERFGQISTYGKSKLAMLYFSIAFARRYPEFHVNVSDPGIVDSKIIRLDRWFDPLTDMFFRPLINTPEKGAIPALRALESDSSLNYFVGKRSYRIPDRFLNSPMVDSLWDQASFLLSLNQE
ncbi:MAG: SDR family NAD(P)-dependent oxidoreductase [Bacteroidales bacterium]|nr:SDR family NAD(P)-dependent oxidoreductase [Candidatus Cryptobacteroides equifaecalis]